MVAEEIEKVELFAQRILPFQLERFANQNKSVLQYRLLVLFKPFFLIKRDKKFNKIEIRLSYFWVSVYIRFLFVIFRL